MILAFGIAIASYVVGVLAIAVVKHRAKKCMVSALSCGDDRKALSLCWAWCSPVELTSLAEYWGEHRFNNMGDIEGSRLTRLMNPVVVFSILSILFYQLFLRPTGLFGLGRCKATPNCSNFAIGCFLRFNWFVALAKVIIRIDSCHAAQPVSFNENFKK